MKLLLITLLFGFCVSKSYHMETGDSNLNDFIITTKENGGLTPLAADIAKHRTKRGIWDVFQKMVITKNLIVDQYTDTRDSLTEVYNLFNTQFSDSDPPKPTRRPGPTEAPKASGEDSSDSSETMKTTTERYSISRFEFGQIVGRNLRGLQRLAKLELQDALNATQYNLQDYKTEANKQFANSLAAEKKKRINDLMMG